MCDQTSRLRHGSGDVSETSEDSSPLKRTHHSQSLGRTPRRTGLTWNKDSLTAARISPWPNTEGPVATSSLDEEHRGREEDYRHTFTAQQPQHTHAFSLLEGPAHGMASRAIPPAHPTAVLLSTRVKLEVTAHFLQQREGPLCWLPAPMSICQGSGERPEEEVKSLCLGSIPSLSSHLMTEFLSL